MDDLFNQLYSNGALLVMWGALLFHLIIPFPRDAHPAILWHKFAELLSSKVNINSSYNQSIISGTLAWLLMCIPAYLVLWALQPLVWQPQLFELALLLIALDWKNNEKLAGELIHALAKEDKLKARKLLDPLLNRDTERLSPLGLGKAGAETLIMGYGRNVICVLFWYGIGGGVAALMYRLTAELARAWSPSRQSYSPFGLPVTRAVAVLDYIPLKLFALIIALGHRTQAVFALFKTQGATWPLPGPSWLLIAVGGKLELSLGGPAIYEKRKAVRAKIGGRIAPSAIHLAQIHKLMAWRICVWLLLQSCILAVVHQGI